MAQLTPPTPAISEAPATETTPPATDQSEQSTIGNAGIQADMKGGDPADPNGGDIGAAATELATAVRAGDMPVLYRLLSGGDRQAILAHYSQWNSQTASGFTGDATLFLGEIDAITAISYAQNGRADLYCKVLVVTRGMFGTDEETLFRLLETAAPADVLKLVETDVSWLNELSGAQYARAAQVLKPYQDALQSSGGKLTPEAREALFAELAKAGPSVDDLIARLEARRGWMDDDEAGMLEDIRTWAAQRGPQPEIDATLLSWLEGQLSAAQFIEAKNTIRTGNERTLDDKIDEANAETSCFGLISNPDEQKIYDSIEEAPADERAAWAETDDAANLGDTIGSSDAEHAMALVESPDKDSAAHLDELLTALEGITYVSDAQVFAALDKMSPAELVRIRTDATIRERIEGSLSKANVALFHEIVGYDLESDPEMSADAQAVELQKSTARMVARAEVAAGSMPGCADVDAIFVAVIDWQRAGGRMRMPDDEALYDRFAAAISGFVVLDGGWYSKLLGAMSRDPVLTDKDRLEYATVDAMGTDDAATDASIEDVGNEELLRIWSNLPDFATSNRGKPPEAMASASEGWTPDISADVRGWLEGDRSGALTDVGKIREKIVAALQTPEGAKLALDEFGYAADERSVAMLRARHAEELQQRSRGDTIMNDVSATIVDPFSGKDEFVDQEYGEFEGASATAMRTGRGSAEEGPALEQAEIERQEFLKANQDYEDLRSATAEIAGSIVSALVGVIATIASAGTASPLAAALCAGVLSSLFGEMTKAAIAGEGYDEEKGAMALVQAVVTGVIAMPLTPLAEGLSGGIAASKLAQTVVASAERALPGIGGVIAKEVASAGLDALVKDFPSNYVGAAMETEGLLRQGLDGVLPVLQATIQDAAIGLVVTGVSHAKGLDEESIKRLTNAGKWDENLEALVKAGVIDILVTTAAERLVSGEPLEPQDFLELLCKTVEMLHGAHTTAEESKTSATDAVKFFNTATPDQLAGLKDAALVATIIEMRGIEKFGNIDDLKAVHGFDDEVFLPVAAAVLADLETKRQAAPAATPAAT